MGAEPEKASPAQLLNFVRTNGPTGKRANGQTGKRANGQTGEPVPKTNEAAHPRAFFNMPPLVVAAPE